MEPLETWNPLGTTFHPVAGSLLTQKEEPLPKGLILA